MLKEIQNFNISLIFIKWNLFVTRNGEEWYRLRAAVRHLMLKPRDVQQFLPGVRAVAQDLMKRFQQIRDKQGFVPDLATEVGKWSQECELVCMFVPKY